MSQPSAGRRIIEVKGHIIGPPAPRLKQVSPRPIGDYASVPAAYRDAARKYSSPWLMGPPICDELMALLQHLYTEEEAAVVRHLNMLRGRTAARVARAEGRPLDEVAAILDRLALQKRSIARSGREAQPRYHIMPIMPGVFEMVLVGCRPETLSPWHRRFIELFETLYETGYSLDYGGATPSVIRFLPVGRAITAHPMALPTDHLEAVLDRFDLFGVGQCQCRLTARARGQGCGKPLGNCAVMGRWARNGIRDGWLREVSKQEMLDIKREAEAHGMVNWMMNVASTKGQCSCSCCGCCCHAMRMVNEFNAPAMFAPPHFRPRHDPVKCSYCGRCVRQCPMAAITVDTRGKTYSHLVERCIGCGLCVLACQGQRALAMEQVPDYKLPYRSWFSLLAGNVPTALRTSWKVWRSRKRGE